MTIIIADIAKAIKYDRETKDYACSISIDGGAAQIIGYAPNYSAGEKLCNDYVFDYLSDTHTHETAAQLLAA